MGKKPRNFTWSKKDVFTGLESNINKFLLKIEYLFQKKSGGEGGSG